MTDCIRLSDYPVGGILQEQGTNRKCRIRKVLHVSGFVFFGVLFQDGERRYIVVREKDTV